MAVMGVHMMAARLYGPLHYGAFFDFLFFQFRPPDLYHFSMFMLAHFAFININLAIFNIIPVYPLAANKLLITFSSPDNIARLNHYEKPMQILLIVLLAFGFGGLFDGTGILPRVLLPITHRIVGIAWGLFF